MTLRKGSVIMKKTILLPSSRGVEDDVVISLGLFAPWDCHVTIITHNGSSFLINFDLVHFLFLKQVTEASLLTHPGQQ